MTGTFVAMSVFKPDLLPSLKPAKGRAFCILHSPDDKVCDVFGMLWRGLRWLESKAEKAKRRKR